MTVTKVTMTLPVDVLAAVDHYVEEHQGATRSGICAQALVAWVQQTQEAEIERYYATMSNAERAEDQGWADLAAYQAERRWQ